MSFEGLLSLRLSDHFALVVGCINNNWLNRWKKCTISSSLSFFLSSWEIFVVFLFRWCWGRDKHANNDHPERNQNMFHLFWSAESSKLTAKKTYKKWSCCNTSTLHMLFFLYTCQKFLLLANAHKMARESKGLTFFGLVHFSLSTLSIRGRGASSVD